MNRLAPACWNHSIGRGRPVIRDGPDSPTRARALVEHDLVLPVLDGLDEIAGSQRVQALGRIREALHYSSMGIVISSRDEEFRAAAEAATEAGAVPDAVVVALGDVTADAAACYLDPGRRGRWMEVFAELGQNSPVGGALRTPLLKNRLAGQGDATASPDPVADLRPHVTGGGMEPFLPG